MQVLVGIVGYYEFVRAYPLGPELMGRLRAQEWAGDVDLREMNWGPIAIVQDLQAAACRPDRVVLVGAADRGLESGKVSLRRWSVGRLDPMAVQRRIFEAVTGVVSLDNLLVIGAQFGVWPAQLLTVELQMGAGGLGDLVLSEIEDKRLSGGPAVIGERELSPENLAVVDDLVTAIRRAVLDDRLPDAEELVIDQLSPPAEVCHNRFVAEEGAGKQPPMPPSGGDRIR